MRKIELIRNLWLPVIILLSFIICTSSIGYASGDLTIKIEVPKGASVEEYKEVNGRKQRTGILNNGQIVHENSDIKLARGEYAKLTLWRMDKKILCKTLTLDSGLYPVKQCLKKDKIEKGSSFGYRKTIDKETLPYIVSPRYTFTTTRFPKLEWNDTGSDEYVVSVYDKVGKELFQHKVNKQSINRRSLGNVKIASISYPYPDLNLEYGQEYLLEVKACQDSQCTNGELGDSNEEMVRFPVGDFE
jgi:hypothetical protein